MTDTRVPTPAPSALAGLRIVEFSGIGLGPFAGMMLADMGADVIVMTVDGKVQPAPAPRLSRTPARPPSAGVFAGQHTAELLAEVGLAPGFLAH